MKAIGLSKAQRADIITTLPQAVIETILCHLTIDEAARTSILSRAWRYKWTTIPELEFSPDVVNIPTRGEPADWWKHVSHVEYYKRKKEIRCKLLYAIHQVLLLRQGPIHEFTLIMDAHQTCFEIDRIILHLSRNHTVKKLAFYFYDVDNAYGLPLSFFSLRHLTDLDLECCYINHKPIFNGFDSLTSLSLSDIRISKETLLHLLSNCPSLKSFCLFLFDNDFLGDEKPSIMELFRCLPAIERLKTWGFIIPSLVQASVPGELPASLIHLKYICVKQAYFVDTYGLPFLAVSTKCCPNLEKIKLVIANDWDEESVVLEECSHRLEEYSEVWLEHLNELEIEYFTNYKPEMEFVKFILARSPNLKVKLMTFMVPGDEKVMMLRVLLRAPRPAHASPVEFVVKKC
ncbi:F-box/FBD/LRR-repeat protein At1g13570-like [Bidens hawaiensis]|uniref:F-box/FBD/LRR-repeat protein At1g13570-like n=1 Tax=Bidens hawaiensis TaxID=980011 RepID=UPI00404B476A